MLTALCGVVLKWLTGSKLIVEIVTAPKTIYKSQDNSRLIKGIMQAYSNVCLHLSLWSCDRVHLLAPALIADYKSLRNVPSSVFFEGVPVTQIPRRAESAEMYVLLVGAPWRVKGVDVLIEAFLRLAPDFPDVKLKILGHHPDIALLEAMSQGSQQIEFLKARPNSEVLEIISKAAIFALPSRSEGVPRVILEAMAAGVPVIGSSVGGIPTIVRDGENGFLVPSEDVSALVDRLRQLLSDAELRNSMGNRGYEMAHAEFSEMAYTNRFAEMVEQTTKGGVLVKSGEAEV
jgi:glycosyltransferase involved in cell wall biosynthesis